VNSFRAPGYTPPVAGYGVGWQRPEGAPLLEYEVEEKHGDAVTLLLRGDLTGEARVQSLHEALKDHYVDDGVTRIRADLRGLRSISLEGVVVLLLLLQESQRRNKTFEVVNATGQVRDKLMTTGVLSFLEPSG
jgi:anti-anti-sigma regulatory factor